MSINRRFRIAAPAALLSLTLIGLISALGAAQEDVDHQVHISAWSTGAKLSRLRTQKEIDALKATRKKGDTKPIPAYKTVAAAKVGTVLQVPDIVESGTGQAELKAGPKLLTRMRAHSVLKLITITPPHLKQDQPADLVFELSKGQVLNRAGTAVQPSKIEFDGADVVTGAKGTAYSLSVVGTKATLVVAEGQVEIALAAAPGDVVTVNPRQKFIYDSVNSGAFPAAPIPVDDGDELLIEELLSMPVSGLVGYVTGQDIRRPDADSIVVVNVERILHHEDSDSYSAYKPKWGTPDTLYFAARDDFWTTDHAAKRMHVGQGFYFEAISPNGKLIYASKPNLGLWRMNWDGSGKTLITSSPIGEVQISPDGKRLIAQKGWSKQAITDWSPQKRKMVKTGASRWIPTGGIFVSLASSGGPIKQLNSVADRGDYAQPYWRRGSKRLIVQIYGDKSRAVVDADQTPPKVLVRTPAGRTSQVWSVSPAGIWAYGTITDGDSQTLRYIRLADGKSFDHKNAVRQRVMLGEQNAVDGDMKVYAIENVDDPGRAFDDERDHTYPQASSDVSPNGEILAYLDDGKELFHVPGNMGDLVGAGGLAAFCDTLNPSRNSVTAVNLKSVQNLTWINGYQVYYSAFKFERAKFPDMILTLAVKKKPKVEESESTGTKPAEKTNLPPSRITMSKYDEPKEWSKDRLIGISDDGKTIYGERWNDPVWTPYSFTPGAGWKDAPTKTQTIVDLALDGDGLKSLAFDEAKVLAASKDGSVSVGQITAGNNFGPFIYWKGEKALTLDDFLARDPTVGLKKPFFNGETVSAIWGVLISGDGKTMVVGGGGIGSVYIFHWQ